VDFRTEPFPEDTEITGHPLAHLAVAIQNRDGATPSDMDIFLTIRHYDAQGNEGELMGIHSSPKFS
jgi:hypothetical protein